VLVSTHYMDEAERCHRLVYISYGKLLAAGTADEVIAQAGGRPVVALQRVGKGRVYWIGYNLAWHAFYSENDDERALIGAVFDEALSPDGASR
jgi:ABC-type multidrug transport system ATPase subunit